MEDKQLQIIKYYGMDRQLEQLIEECGELIQAICKWKRYKCSDSSIDVSLQLIGELGDVKNLIEQLELDSDYIKEGISRTIESKVNREVDRISRG